MEKTSPQSTPDTAVRLGKYTFFPKERKLCLGQQSIGLTEKESGLLSLFCNFANRLLPRNYALVSLWQGDTSHNARAMDVYVSRLRKHLKDDPDILIMNVHGRGFKMLAPCTETIPGNGEKT